jgi:Cellulase (glycosyl hydrolase family 5)
MFIGGVTFSCSVIADVGPAPEMTPATLTDPGRTLLTLLMLIVSAAVLAWSVATPTRPPDGLPELGFSLNGEELSGPIQQSHYNELASLTPSVEWARLGFSSDGDWQGTSQRYFDAATTAGMKVLLRASFPDSQYNGSEPVDISAYGDFVAALAARYQAQGLGGTNPVMELPNEINGTSITGATYAAAACDAYPKLKAVDPDYTIIGASENVYDPNWKTWLEEVYQGGFANCSDGVSFHNYDTPGEGARYDFLRSVMTKYDDLDAAVWVTEFGATTCTPESSSALGCRTEQQQADIIVGTIREIRDRYPWITHAILYADEDVPSRKATDKFEAHFGIYRNDANGNITGAKPAVAALKTLYQP